MFWKVSSRTVAIYQIITSAGFIYAIGYTWFFVRSPSSSFFVVTLLLYVLLLFINLYAGIELYRGRERGYLLSLLNIAAQVPAVNLLGVAYKYVGFVDLSPFVFINSTEGRHLFGLGFHINPGTFWVGIGQFKDQPQIAINLISLSFVLFLIRAMRQKTGAIRAEANT